MADLKGTQTVENLRVAFAGESQANRRYLYFAEKADLEGAEEVAQLFRSISQGETKHAFGHFDRLRDNGEGDPATKLPVGTVEQMLESAIAGETYEYTEMYPGFAAKAREEGLPEIAEWMEVMAKAERVHAQRFQKLLDSLGK
ncbi:rubrerythrin family protein [Alicyclobacillus mengziensis]|uniref:Rubrerythrin family protein n=1 Tax=Alicyclobacillus mengziensis TaxID=2931921 RepID=A0A9X7Z6H6_9BACL|nr:rubrerythrin family protein [Alicyclobacillus mengziensis]QSO46218.1 rubrerythrin family protein [Alicyclobacillus mengziensis]